MCGKGTPGRPRSRWEVNTKMNIKLTEKLCGKGTAGRPRSRWEVNIKMDIK
jgi:hypothetical protein